MPKATTTTTTTQRALAAAPVSSVNVEARTFSGIISDASPVFECVFDRKADRWIDAMVSLPPENVDLSRLPGMPLQDGHRTGSIKDTLGLVESISQEGDKLVANFRLARSTGDLILDVADGMHRQISIQYQSDDFDITFREGQPPLAVARSYVILEVSLVPIGANAVAMTRSNEPKPTAAEMNKRAAEQETPMDLEQLVADAEAALQAVVHASDEGASEEVAARAKRLRDFMSGDAADTGTTEDPEKKKEDANAGTEAARSATGRTAQEEAECAAIVAAASNFNRALGAKLEVMRGVGAKVDTLRETMIADMATTAVTEQRSGGFRADDIEPRRTENNNSRGAEIDLIGIYDRVNSRFKG